MRRISVDKSNPFRSILTDTVPYELPFFFTNENLYLAATESSDLTGFPSIVKSLLRHGEPSRPFSYDVQKGGGSLRKISLPHPAAQLKFADFYDSFDTFIESICARSKYSIRYPTRIGSYFYQSQFVGSYEPDPGELTDVDPTSFGTQRRWASSYFHYREFSHISKFYSSDDFRRLEQRHSKMMQLDISRCFESIYTHSLSWAVRGKEFSKTSKGQFFFESEFDRCMQNANWGETNGIVIGPEVSRIFAEIILQSIDVALDRSIKDTEMNVDVRRYVDDYYIFSNSEESLFSVKRMLQAHASSFNLHLNDSKEKITSRPLLSEISLARDQVARTVGDYVRLIRDAIDPEKRAHISQKVVNSCIESIRHIARNNNVDYSILASTALSVMSRGLSRLVRRTQKLESPHNYGEVIADGVLRLSDFFFQMDIRSSTSHKIAKIYSELSSLYDLLGGQRKAFEAMICDGCRSALKRAKESRISGPEILNLMIAADAICRTRRAIVPKDVEFTLRQAPGKSGTENYFELVGMLYFSRNLLSFRKIREYAVSEIERRVSSCRSRLHENAEDTMLFFDAMSCPYIDEQRLFDLFGRVCASYRVNAAPQTLLRQFHLVRSRFGFTAWNGSKFFQAILARKELQPAYQ